MTAICVTVKSSEVCLFAIPVCFLVMPNYAQILSQDNRIFLNAVQDNYTIAVS